MLTNALLDDLWNIVGEYVAEHPCSHEIITRDRTWYQEGRPHQHKFYYSFTELVSQKMYILNHHGYLEFYFKDVDYGGDQSYPRTWKSKYNLWVGAN
jgi:hypothetical protein